jgi:hypothetical protein
MRAKEFISEDRQKLDEIAPLVIAGWALTAGTAAWQAYDTYNDIQTYNKSEKTEADLDKLKAAVGMDVLALVAGGAVGKLVGKAITLGATPFAAVKNIYNARKQADAAKKAAEKAADASKKTADKVVKPEPGSVVKTAAGKKAIAGVDGKATTVKPSDTAGIAKIKKAADQSKTVTQKVGAAAGKVVDKVKDVVKKKPSKGTVTKPAGAASGKLAKKAGPASGKLAKKAGPASGKLAKKAGPASGKLAKKAGPPLGKKVLPYAAGALAGKTALNVYDKMSGDDKPDPSTTGAGSGYTYTGKDFKTAKKSDFKAKVTKWSD